MRRILVVDDDLHTRLAIRTWLNRCGFRVAIADSRDRRWWHQRPCGARRFSVRPDGCRYLDAEYARLRVDQGFSSACADGPADRDFRLRLSKENGARPARIDRGAMARLETNIFAFEGLT
jgi:hypothetical protein